MKKIIQMALPILLAILLLTACQSNTTDANSDVIKMPSNYAKYEGKNYLDVYKSLKELGFYDIEFEVIEDLITGWLVADGEVESVSIDGDDSFRRGDVFDKNSKVIIAYHTFKSNISSNTEQKPTENEKYYNVSFNENGGTNVNDLTFKAGYEINIYQDIPSTTKEGYRFLGWYFENGEEFPTRYCIEKNIALVAHWEKILSSDWEYAFVKFYHDYDVYYMFDVDTSEFVTFTTCDTYIGKGIFVGDIESQSPVKLIYDDTSISNYEQFQNIGSFGVLTDFAGTRISYTVEPYPYRAEAILNEIKSQRGDTEGNQDSTIETQGEIYEYAYFDENEHNKLYVLLDIDEDRFAYFNVVNEYYEEGNIDYHSTSNCFKLGEIVRLSYDDYSGEIYYYFTAYESSGVFSMRLENGDGADYTFERDFNVAEAESLLEEIKNN